MNNKEEIKMQTKVVNIYPTRPIIGVNPPIRSMVKGTTKSIDEIRQCLIERAMVEEVCGDKIIRLGMHNYNKDNFKAEAHTYKKPMQYNAEPKVPVVNPSNDLARSMYDAKQQEVYDKAYAEIVGKLNLASMSRKERRRIERSAKDHAEKAVAEAGKKSADGTMVNENTATNTVEDTKVHVEEPVVETMDLESIDESMETHEVKENPEAASEA